MEVNGQLHALLLCARQVTPVSIEYEAGRAPEPVYAFLSGFEPRSSGLLPKPLHLLRYLDLPVFLKIDLLNYLRH